MAKQVIPRLGHRARVRQALANDLGSLREAINQNAGVVQAHDEALPGLLSDTIKVGDVFTVEGDYEPLTWREQFRQFWTRKPEPRMLRRYRVTSKHTAASNG
jgi:hypothetical protein